MILYSTGHAECLDFVRHYNLPLLLLGGGGYTIRNVARCWTYETAVALNCDIANGNHFLLCLCLHNSVSSFDPSPALSLLSPPPPPPPSLPPSLPLSPSSTELPYNDYFEYYGPDFKLHISPTNMTNQNTPEYLNKIKSVTTVEEPPSNQDTIRPECPE